MQEYQTHQIIDQIIELDARHVEVARSLLRTMADDDPDVAQAWIDLAADASRDRMDRLGLLILPVSVFQVLHSHVRYGYVIEWLGKWSVESFRLKEELAKRLPFGWSDVDDVLTTELKSRAQPPKG